MKKYSALIIPFFVMMVSCSRQLKDMNVDMATKVIYGGPVIIQEDPSNSVFKPDTLFFKRLDIADNFSKGTVIKSSVHDSEGNIVINGEPGIYVLIAARYFNQGTWIIVDYDEKIMKYTLVDLKAGETKIFPKLNTIAQNGMWIDGHASDAQKLNREIIGNEVGNTMHTYLLGIFNPAYHKDMEAKKRKEEASKEEAKKVEEFK